MDERGKEIRTLFREVVAQKERAKDITKGIDDSLTAFAQRHNLSKKLVKNLLSAYEAHDKDPVQAAAYDEEFALWLALVKGRG